jgi:tetratricopeptide (TPR) repeat protein
MISLILLGGGHGVWSHEAKAPYQEAVRAYSQNRDAEAVDAFEAAIRARPDFLQAHYNVAMCYEFYLHNTPKALGHYRQYVALGGNDARVRQLLQATKQE